MTDENLTRGEKAARTRAANKAKKEQEALKQEALSKPTASTTTAEDLIEAAERLTSLSGIIEAGNVTLLLSSGRTVHAEFYGAIWENIEFS